MKRVLLINMKFIKNKKIKKSDTFIVPVILNIIRLYWIIKPKNWNRNCNFKVSCSRYVYNAVYDNGFLAGIKAFKTRWNRCRSVYWIEWKGNRMKVRFRDGYLADLSELSELFSGYVKFSHQDKK